MNTSSSGPVADPAVDLPGGGRRDVDGLPFTPHLESQTPQRINVGLGVTLPRLTAEVSPGYQLLSTEP